VGVNVANSAITELWYWYIHKWACQLWSVQHNSDDANWQARCTQGGWRAGSSSVHCNMTPSVTARSEK